MKVVSYSLTFALHVFCVGFINSRLVDQTLHKGILKIEFFCIIHAIISKHRLMLVHHIIMIPWHMHYIEHRDLPIHSRYQWPSDFCRR